MEENVGVKIKMLRKENKDTLKSLAEKINYDWSNLSKVERGVYTASIELIRKISEVYDVNPNYFLSDFTESEGKLISEGNLDISQLKKKFDFRNIDGVEATDDEIMEAIRLLRFLKQQS
jgi:transcriptional regulator with XRE-family HTH domain